MSDPNEEVEKAAAVLDGPALGPEPAPSDEQAETSSDDADATTETETTSNEVAEPTGIDRLFRTDRSLDLDDATPFWDPGGKGGVNRIGAALKQAGGWKALPPIVWVPIGVAEAVYVAADERGILPNRGGERDDR